MLDPATPEWIGFHDEDGHWFGMLLILRHWHHGIIAIKLLRQAV